MQKVNRSAQSEAPGGAVRPSIREIEALRAMIATGKTTHAARDLGTSQPSVSRAIASLETRLGEKLFTRRNGRLLPTAQALELEARAAVVFDLLDQLVTPSPETSRATAIRIATPPTLANLFLAPLLTRFIAREPTAGCRSRSAHRATASMRSPKAAPISGWWTRRRPMRACGWRFFAARGRM